MKACSVYLHSFPIFQSLICACFEIPSIAGLANLTKTLHVTNHQSSLLRLQLIYGILLDIVLNMFIYNPVYERGGFRMWGSILEKYNSKVKDALFESVFALYSFK